MGYLHSQQTGLYPLAVTLLVRPLAPGPVAGTLHSIPGEPVSSAGQSECGVLTLVSGPDSLDQPPRAVPVGV